MTDAEILAAFQADYPSARDQFRRAAGAVGWTLTSHATDGTGPAGEPLSIDVAISGPAESRQPAVIVSSGLHGVEGHFGSAVQTAWLQALARGAARDTRVRCVFVHALNPYGFAWSRRCDAANIDLNRAFRWTGMPASSDDDAYAGLDGLLNPASSSRGADGFVARLLWRAMRQGMAHVRRVIASGQRSFPKGLFFAGTAVTPLQRWMEREVPVWAAGAPEVVHLDLHTGLGRSAAPALIVDHALTEASRQWMTRVFGESVLRESLRDATVYTATGSLGQWCVSQAPHERYRFAFAEFGTFGAIKVLSALRAENRAHFWSAGDSAAATSARAELREVFCPSDARWRVRAVRGGLKLIDQAVAGLAESLHDRPTMPHGARLGE